MSRQGRQVQVWFDEDTYEAIADLAAESSVRVTHVVEALGRMVRDGTLSQAHVRRLVRAAAEVKAERDARQGHGPKPSS